MNMQTGLLNWTPYMNKHVRMHSAYRTAETHMHTSLLRNVHKQAHVCACAQVTAAAAAAAERAEPRRSRLPPAHARRLAAQADRQADRPLAARLRRFAAAPGLESRGKHRPTDRQTSHGCPWWRRLCPTTAAAAAACVAVAAAAADARAAAALAAALAAAALAAAALAAAGQCLPHRRDASVHATRAAVL